MSRVVENIKCLACDSDNIHIALDLGLQYTTIVNVLLILFKNILV